MGGYSVYIHTAPSGRVYIGISTNPVKRWNEGKGYVLNQYFWGCIQKYGWENIKHEIVYDGLSLEDAKKKEIELISEYKSNVRKYGYNIREGGDCGAAAESRKKMSISRLGNKNCVGRKLSNASKTKTSLSLKEYYSNHQPAFAGKHHSQETIEKLKSRVISEETRQKMRDNHADVSGKNNPSARIVSCFTSDGKYIKSYPCARMAAEEMHKNLSSIIKCCRGKTKTCGGLVWKYGEPGVYGWNEIV